MLSDLPTGFGTIYWFIEEGASGIWTAFLLLVVGVMMSRTRLIAAWLIAKAPLTLRWLIGNRGGLIRSYFRRRRLRELRWIRSERFDEMSIQRNVSRGHACAIIFVIWFGLWVVAMGMRESFILSDAPLAKSPGITLMAALPMYAFEIAWLYFSLSSGKLINYRNRVKIWRWWYSS